MANKNRGYNLPKALCIRGELTRVWMLGTLSDINPTMDLAIHDGVEVSIRINQREKGCKGIGL
jgi:hypothetical protein